MSHASFLEADMFLPLKRYFVAQGYQVNAEAKHCDIVLTKDSLLTIIEMKRVFSVDLLIQALDRQTMTAAVYIAIPRPKKCYGDKHRGMLTLVKRLRLGLIFVAMDSPALGVEVVVTPDAALTQQTKRGKRRTAALQKELDGRQADTNTGGVTKTKLATAFREKSIHALCVLERVSPLRVAEIKQICGNDVAVLLGRNYYGWFERVGRGQYALSTSGQAFLQSGEFATLVTFYRQQVATGQLGAIESFPPAHES